MLKKDWRSILISFYEEHNPSKVSDVDSLLKKYKGKEEKLYSALLKRYGDSKSKEERKQGFEEKDSKKMKSTQKLEKKNAKKAKEMQEEEDFKAFAEFSASLDRGTVQAKDEEEASSDESENVIRAEKILQIEQANLQSRLEELKRKQAARKRGRKDGNDSPNSDVKNNKIMKLLRERREAKRRRQEEKSNSSFDPTAFDPLDWRNSLIQR
eukprot:g329.t1